MTSPERMLDTDICVIGAGAAGLSVAAGAVQMGARVVLVERGRMGGDCLNAGCIPSKALITRARAVAEAARWPELGLLGAPPVADFARVKNGIADVIADIAPHDSPERFRSLGVEVIEADARFLDRNRLMAGDRIVTARRFVIATGSRPALPPIEGLERVVVHTNETIFSDRMQPEHLVVLGGGPVGVEMAQAHRRLGSAVTLATSGRLLPTEDPELVAVVRDRLLAEGVVVLEQARAVAAAPRATGDGVRLHLAGQGSVRQVVEGDQLLVATGRRPVTEGLDLAAAGVEVDAGGIRVDARLRTSNARIFAIGDCIGGIDGAAPQRFTHMAGHHAGIVIRQALFRLPARVETRAVPRVIFTDPELARVGPTEAEARAMHGDIRVLRWPFAEVDRARTEGRRDGLVKVLVGRRGRILGAGIVGEGAGELLQSWELAIREKLKIGAMAGLITAYPTRAEASKRAAGQAFTELLFGSRSRRLVRLLLRLP
ncbi:MAG: dihydrolipoamide dehydrogenase [Tistrella sp.]|uniref:Dihydrolipoamide dehydrogenase n=1 Tax=Tistrella mobilis TaxID=171437 RepID=A0A3B9IQG5_9PROT|nr:FAD-dependent oxidoreductase [Tistrella sp.]MAD38939.1 dihydrolipoamide dehydrogenase [Tistrella sp.]MBA76134.1 dihydrolipoamide dehydrogenase [Tistrella sp.]HAE50122.1 dihydrolipoamide dehydrogenase [Tistrella mobilis]